MRPIELVVPAEGFRVFEIDCPWKREAGGGKIKRGADRHYGLLSNVEIVQQIKDSGIWRLDERGALGFMWATTATLLHGDVAAVCKGLGVVPVSAFVWAKVEAFGHLLDGRPLFSPVGRPGLGQWTRHEHEHLIIVRTDGDGAADLLPPKNMRQRSIIYAPRAKRDERRAARGDVEHGDEHSTKPAEALALIAATSAHLRGHRLEVFARAPRPDAWVWGTLNGPRTKPVLLPPDPSAGVVVSTTAEGESL